MIARIGLKSKEKKRVLINKQLYPSIIILCFYFKLFYFIRFPGTFGNRTNGIIPMLLCDCMLMAAMFKKKSFFNIPHLKYFLSLFIFLLLDMLYTFVEYPDEPFMSIVAAASTYTLLFSYFIFYNAAKECFKEFIKIVLLFSTITAMLFIIQALIFNNFGRQILNIYGFSYSNIVIVFRSGVRIIACDMVTYSAVISAGCLFCKEFKNKKLYKINIAIVIIYELYVSQTRGAQLIVFATLLLVVVFSGKRRGLLRYVKILLFISVLFLSAQEIKIYISEIVTSVIRKTDFSMYQRVAEIQHYLSVLKTKWLMGIGFLGTHTVYDKLISGGQGYTYSDVGIVGVLAHFGVVGVIIYIVPLIDFIKKRKTKNREINSIALAAAVATLVSCISLSLWDAERMIVYPVLWAIVQVSAEEKEKKYVKNGIYFVGRSK